MLTMLAACGSSSTQAPAQAPAQASAQPAADDGRKVLNVGRSNELFDMDSTIATEADCLEVISAIIEPLFFISADGTPVNGLAESYEVNEDGTEYIFHIREAARKIRQ